MSFFGRGWREAAAAMFGDEGPERAAMPPAAPVERMHEHEPTAVAVRSSGGAPLAEVTDRLQVIERTLGELLHRNSGAAFTSELPPVNVILPAPLVCPVCEGRGGGEVETTRTRRTLRADAKLPAGWGEREAEEAGVLHEFYDETDELAYERRVCGPCLGTGVARPARQEVVLRMVRA